ncbi:hypothetical protein [Salipaludibacillus agaradhaerens]|jgi:hypothetical protein|nr:hypothetical protein [Salipaludibacillus agaradhaerens]
MKASHFKNVDIQKTLSASQTSEDRVEVLVIQSKETVKPSKT